MSMEHYFQETLTQNEFSEEDGISVEKLESYSASASRCEDNLSGGFDCNICLDFVREPVVTLCGHLYCWPCIYKWIHFQRVSTKNPKLNHPQCPVCKAEVSEGALVPLYGRGQIKQTNAKAPNIGIVVPQRPPCPPWRGHILIPSHQQLHRHSYPQGSQANHSHLVMTDAFHPLEGMFGKMVFARIFGNSETALYAYPNSYHLAGSNSPRVRRHMMLADESLSRVCFFLCCCLFLCLLLF